jgi:cytochrome c biogenesis protein CcmG/thiol:disulfide interchange protein DsbE
MRHRLPLLIAFCIACTGCSSASPPASGTPASPPSELPAVPLATLSGDRSDVARLAEGRVALVSLWATWCESCQKEMDALNRLAAVTAEGRDAIVIGVDVGEEPEAVAAFARRRGLRYAQLVDEHFDLADAVGQRRVPCTLVLDRRGRIVFRGDALDARALEALRRAISAPVSQ